MVQNEPWSLEQQVRLIGEERRAEAEHYRLARQAGGPRTTVRVMIAGLLRALASRLDGEVFAPRPNPLPEGEGA
jgi:hypothetical protein